jgi:hypothetical protein
MIDVLVPVLARARNVAPFVESFRVATPKGSQIHFLCSPGDEEEIAACQESGEHTLIMEWTPERSDYPRKMNFGFSVTEQPWILLGSDDIEFTPGWLNRALRTAKDTKASVIATNDMANRQVMSGQFGTHSLVRRAYVEEQGASMDGPGVLIHEGYDHNFCDRELCHVAEYRGLYAFSEGSHVRHRHPHWKSARMDSTYKKGLRTFREDQALFLSRGHLWNYCGMSEPEKARGERSKSQS